MIQQVLSIFNFGASIKRWIETFYCNAENSVINNGFTTRQLKLSRGVKQGCPLSSYLFILSAEILATKIRQDNSVCAIFIFHKELKISQFADDTSLICSNLLSAQNALLILNEFEILSGLKLNESKTKAVWRGPWNSAPKDPSTSCGRKNRLRSWGFISLTIKREMRGKMSIKTSITLMQSWVLGDRAKSLSLGAVYLWALFNRQVSRDLTDRTLCCRARHPQGLHRKNSIFNF